MSRSYNPLDYIPHLIVGCIIAMPLFLFVCAIDQGFGSDKVLDTYSGQKSVCTRYQFNSSLKVTQCVERVMVAATCKKIEHTGPVFGVFTNERCE
jgi:hypothetical protein